MKIFIVILMFVYVIYVTNTVNEAGAKRLSERNAFYYLSMAIITLVYLACCMYSLINMGC